MASVTERKNKSGVITYQAKVRRHGVTLSETFSTKTAAEAWARKQESEIERGLWRDSSEAERTTLHEALERYGREVTALKRGKSQENYLVRLLADEPLARLTLARVRSADVAGAVDVWRKAGYAPATIARRLSIVSHVFETARKSWGMESLANPVRLIKLPQLRNARERRVSDDELDVLCGATQSAILPAIVRLAVETGMRRGELVSLRWEYVDLGRRVLHIPDSKNGYPRDVPLSSRAASILGGIPRNINGRVFDCREDTITQAMDRACERAGLENLRFHDLRHEATSRLAEKLSVHELAKVTGHRDLRMLMRYYHPRAEDLAKKLG